MNDTTKDYPTRLSIRSVVKQLNLESNAIDGVIKKLGDAVASSQINAPMVVFTPNAEQVVQASEDEQFLQDLRAADMLLPDGMGLVWSYVKLMGTSVQRVSGVDVMRRLCDWAIDNEKKVYLLGGRDNVGVRAKKRILADWEAENGKEIDERVIAVDSGPQNFDDETLGERVELMQRMSEYGPDIVFVAFGAPKQERWVIENKKALKKMGVKVVIVVGGALDMIAGDLKRAPVWMQNVGLEWLYRLVQEPWRWRRQMRLVRFGWAIYVG